jgi:hypothetical protein
MHWHYQLPTQPQDVERARHLGTHAHYAIAERIEDLIASLDSIAVLLKRQLDGDARGDA